MEATGIKAEDERPTLLLVGEGETMDAALERSLDRHRLLVESCSAATVVENVLAAAPDLVLLVGDAAHDGGAEVLRLLASNPATSVVPVAVLSEDTSLDHRMRVFRSGAVAVVHRGASADAIARRVAEIARELPERPGEATGELGEATLDELLDLVKHELRSGILSVENAGEENRALRIVLGAGRPVSDVLSEFVERLKPLIAKAEPLRYELLEESGGRLQLLDPEDTGEGADLEVLRGLRVLVVDDDPGRADALAQELRARDATVAVTDATGRGLERARGLDPEVVILDAAGLEGPGFDVVRTLRRDPRFRWAQLLVASWDEIWPQHRGTPDMQRLAFRIGPLIEQDRALAERAQKEEQFDTRLEITGPTRLLRALCGARSPLHVTVRNPKVLVEVDVTEGLVVGATATRHGSEDEFEGSAALAALMVLSSGRVRVERRGNPRVANVMAPVDEAIAAAAGQAPPIDPSLPPAPDSGPARAVRDDTQRIDIPPSPKVPFPSAEAIKDGAPEPPTDDDPEPTGTGPLVRPRTRASVRTGGIAEPSPTDLAWSDGNKGPPAPPAARKRTVLGYMPPKPAKPLHRTPAAPRSPTDEAPTLAPPPMEQEQMVRAMEEDTELDAAPPTELALAAPAAREEDATVPSPLASREDDVIPTRGDDAAAAIELADSPHPGGAPSTPSTPEALPDATAPVLHEPWPVDEEPPLRPKGGGVWIAVVLVLVVLLVAAGVAAVALVPALRERVLGDDEISTTGVAPAAGEEGAPAEPHAGGRAAGEEPSAEDAELEETSPVAEEAAPAEEEPPAQEEAPAAEEPAPGEIPAEVRRLSAGALVNRGNEALRDDDLAMAEQLFRLALDKDRHENHAMTGLAQVYIARGDGPRAVEWAEKAVQLRRRRTAYRVLLGDALALAGRADDARQEYVRVLRDEPRNPAALRGLSALRE